MRMLLILLVALAVLVGASYAGEMPQLGIALKVPLAGSVQLTLPIGVAIEAGLTQVGPAVFAAKLYLNPLDLAGLLLVPFVGVGGGVAFLPGGNVATGFYALTDLEAPIPKTQLNVISELAVTLPWPVGAGGPGVGGDLGLRFDF